MTTDSDSAARFRHLGDSVSRGRLEALRDAVKPILANNLLPHFTDHTVSHSDSLVAIIDQFINPIQSGQHALQPQELMALYGACYLHDIGMQFERAGETEVIRRQLHPPLKMDGIDDAVYHLAWEDLSEDERRRLLREYHHEIAAELVVSSVRASEPPVGIQLADDYLPDVLASLCEAHCIDPEHELTCERYQSLVQQRGPIRVALLSALLRVADILDASGKRARREKARALLLDCEAQLHWWRHYYTKDITFEKNNAIRLWFEFPPSRNSDYSEVVPLLQMRYIEQEFRRGEPVFRSVSLPWYLDQHVIDAAHSTMEEMPEAVFLTMKRLLSQDSASALQQLASAEGRFLNASAAIGARLKALRDSENTLSPAERLREVFSVATDLSASGGKRSAWNLLYGAFDANKSTMPPSEQVEIGCALALMMMNDDNSDRAYRLIRDLAPIADNLPDDDLRKAEYWRLRARGAFANLFDETEAAMERAVSLNSDATVMDELATEKCEWHALQGQLQDSVACLDGSDVTPGSTPTRSLVAALRSRAMLGDIAGAVAAADAAVASAVSAESAVSLAMTKAELLYLDGRDQESLDVFQSVIMPLLDSVETGTGLIAMDNQLLASLSLRDAGSVQEFYSLHDRRNLAGVELWDANTVISGRDAADQGKHYDALPKFWGQVVGTHRARCWRAFRWASKEMAMECLKIATSRQEPSWIADATFHALNAEDTELADLIGKTLLTMRDPNRIASAIDVVLTCANLRRHSVIGASLLKEIGDAIPDDRLV